MTILVENAGQQQNGTHRHQLHPSDDADKQYKQVMKSPKAHERSIVGVDIFRHPSARQPILATVAHDSLKLWSITGHEDDLHLIPLRTLGPWNCGVQSYSFGPGHKAVSVLSSDSTLFHIPLELGPHSAGALGRQQASANAPGVDTVQKGLMELWFVRHVPGPDDRFLTINFHAGQLQLLDQPGQVLAQAPFEKARQVSALASGDRFIAAGSSQGLIFVLRPETLSSLYQLEGHSMKVRCVTFVAEDGDQLLSGSDDKSIKLFSLTEQRATLVRVYCGHKGPVIGLAVCRASGGERFASAGTDNCLIVWAKESGDRLHVFADCTGTINDVPASLAFSPNGRLLVAGTDEATILVHRVPVPVNFVDEEEETEEEAFFEESVAIGEEEEEMGVEQEENGGEEEEEEQMSEGMQDEAEETTAFPHFDDSEAEGSPLEGGEQEEESLMEREATGMEEGSPVYGEDGWAEEEGTRIEAEGELGRRREEGEEEEGLDSQLGID